MANSRSANKAHVGAYIPRDMFNEIAEISRINGISKTDVFILMIAEGLRHYRSNASLPMASLSKPSASKPKRAKAGK